MDLNAFNQGLGIEKPGPDASPIDHGIWAFGAVATAGMFRHREDPRTRLSRPREAVAYLMGRGNRQVTWTPSDGSGVTVVTSDEEAVTLPDGHGVGVVLGEQVASSPLTMPAGDTNELLTPTEAAEMCGVHRNSIHRWRKTGRDGVKLRTTKIGGTVRVRRGDLHEFIETLSDPRTTEKSSSDDLDERMKQAAAACEALGC